jgi:hypothetical protein
MRALRVSNVQFLARRLLLESLGDWRYLGTLHKLENRRGRKSRRFLEVPFWSRRS